MKHPIVFNHIPKTGGTTLRIIFNRVYGENAVFFINSRDIRGSLEAFKSLPESARSSFQVISGHGAEFFESYLNNPFKISVLREPVSLFLSQYHYLKYSKNSNFLEEVSKLKSEEEYLEYAISKGQDNLLTRYFSNSMQFLIDEESSVPDMEKEGPELLEIAKRNLQNYHALIELSNFDSGVYALAKALNWPRIPIYRPTNITKEKKKNEELPDDFLKKLKHVLRFDLGLYQYFLREEFDISGKVKNDLKLNGFLIRQKGLRFLVRMMGKK